MSTKANIKARNGGIVAACAVIALAACGGSGIDDLAASSGGVSQTAAVTTLEPARAQLDSAAAQTRARLDAGQAKLDQAGTREVADASYEPPSINYVPPLGFGNYRTAQSFTPTQTGILATVSVLVQPCTSPHPDIEIQVRAGTSIVNPIVARGTIASPTFGPPTGRPCGGAIDPTYWLTADVRTSNYTVNAGQVYSIWPYSPTEGYVWVGGSSTYPGGTAILPSGPQPCCDLGFRTTLLVR